MTSSLIPIKVAPGSYRAIVNGEVTQGTVDAGYTISAKSGQLLSLIYGGGIASGEGGYGLVALVSDPHGQSITGS